ncbi:MAG: ATP:cob(I)alamin adenosyltransferase, partial [Rhodospirillaceae bacterium]|nr:ATP:cob(I)alamin adenosyltransferase [Rhodospirillaceae bacterium]
DKIYTRGGDGGETSLAGGKRVAKHDVRVAAMGSQRFGPAFRNKVMRVRLALHGLVVLVLGLLILSGM